jgi:hypothetical protein
MWRRFVSAIAESETPEDGREVTELGLKGGGILIIVALRWRGDASSILSW